MQEAESLEGAGLGFTGKQIIHPDQIEPVQRAFSPAPAKVEWASRLVNAFDAQQGRSELRFAARCSSGLIAVGAATGVGAFEFEGLMIDAVRIAACAQFESLRIAAKPTVKIARQLLARAQMCGLA